MKCPACGFETSDEQGWCDFCKEPFRKRASGAGESPQEAAPSPSGTARAELPLRGKVKVPAEVMRKLMEAKTSEERKPVDPGIPAEFSGLDAGERMPEVSSNVRKLAWAVLFVIVFWMIAGTVYMFMKGSAIRTGKAPVSRNGPVPGPAEPNIP